MTEEINKTPLPEENGEEAEVKRFGGYSSRHEYEMQRSKKRKIWLTVLQSSILVIFLIFLALFAVDLLLRLRTASDGTAGGEGDTIKVPTQSDLSAVEKEPPVMLKEVDPSLVTLEVRLEDGSTLYGSAFFVSNDGYAVCSSHLFATGASVKEIVGHATGGMCYSVSITGTVEELGFSLVRLEENFGSVPVTVGNFLFVERGETLFAAPPCNVKEFRGTALSGVVAATDSGIRATVGEDSVTSPVLFLDMTPNESLWGAPVVDLTGAAVGICTKAVQSSYGEMVGVVSIHTVFTLINELLAE